MSFSEHIEAIAKSAVMIDATDLPGLVALQDEFKSARIAADEAGATDAAALADAAIQHIEDIVLRTIDDVGQHFNLVLEIIEQLQRTVDGISAHGNEPGQSEAVASTDPALIASWIDSSLDLIASLEPSVLALESGTLDPSSVDEELGHLRRGLHTIKGECGVLGRHDIQRVFHEAESRLDASLESGISISAQELLALLDWFNVFLERLREDPAASPDDCEAMCERLRQSAERPHPNLDAADDDNRHVSDAGATDSTLQSSPEALRDDSRGAVVVDIDDAMRDNLQDFLAEARDHINAAEEALLDLEKVPDDHEQINTVFRAFHTIKGVAGFMNLTAIVDLAHNAEYLLDAARSRTLTLNPPLMGLILISCDMLRQLTGVLEGGGAPTKGRYDAINEQLQAAVQGRPVDLDAIPEDTEPAESDDAAGAGAGASDTGRSGSMKTRDRRSNSGSGERRVDQTVKVSTQRMDNLVTMVGELVIAQQMVIQDADDLQIQDERLQRNLGHVWKIVRDLQEVSMSLRMVSLRGLFQKMSRLVRDIAAKSTKQIQFVTEGEDVEIDRNVVEEIADPLVHMIRNSCDHGIESPDDRRAAGKPDTGHLTLRAYHGGGSIVIEIEDDGRGLDREKILCKALDRGVLSADRDVSEMSDQEVYKLVFLPGFSTADEVTDLSGRGVGMDVVRRNIEAMRGKVDIRSTPSRGTTFIIQLPLTMAIIDGMIVRVGSERYVVPTLSIERSFRPSENELHTVVGRGEMVSVRGTLLPVYRLGGVLGRDDGETDPTESLLVVIEAGDDRCCVMVDEIIGQQQVVIKNLGLQSQSIPGVSGGAILGDGRVALILDINGIIGQAAADDTCISTAVASGDIEATAIA